MKVAAIFISAWGDGKDAKEEWGVWVPLHAIGHFEAGLIPAKNEGVNLKADSKTKVGVVTSINGRSLSYGHAFKDSGNYGSEAQYPSLYPALLLASALAGDEDASAEIAAIALKNYKHYAESKESGMQKEKNGDDFFRGQM